MNCYFSIIIPVYNRPNEINELLASFTSQDYASTFEIIIIEDGSTLTCETVVKQYEDSLFLRYFYKENSGPGASRNFGMQRAKGDYFIILDSDVILPPQYLSEVDKALQFNYTDAFGGPDASHDSFSNLQKAINYSMTSVLTTGGIRGKKTAVGKFQPRSFNMGISKKAFQKTKGFADYRAGEDIDLTFRLWQNQFKTQLITNAFVYHKRRSTLKQFLKQTYAFGTARPLLNKRYPSSAKITYWFPSLFIIGLFFSIMLAFVNWSIFITLYSLYFVLIFIHSLIVNKNSIVALFSIVTSVTQFLGYGCGFFYSYLRKK